MFLNFNRLLVKKIKILGFFSLLSSFEKQDLSILGRKSRRSYSPETIEGEDESPPFS
jgi:hypothetical protein